MVILRSREANLARNLRVERGQRIFTRIYLTYLACARPSAAITPDAQEARHLRLLDIIRLSRSRALAIAASPRTTFATMNGGRWAIG